MRQRSTKERAKRIGLDYFKRPTSFERARRWGIGALVACAALWFSWSALSGDQRAFSSGPLSRPHAILSSKCEACHRGEGGFVREAANRACLGCHDGPDHHASSTQPPACAACHMEHRGDVQLTRVKDENCTACHGALKTAKADSKFTPSITSFGGNHPEIAALRPGSADRAVIRFNHARHLKPALRGPDGGVQLICADCHRAGLSSEPWRFGAASASPAVVPVSRTERRAYMQPVSYDAHCSRCHPLFFDARVRETIPHGKQPEVVRAFLNQSLSRFAAAHPSELSAAPEPAFLLPGTRPEIEPRAPAQWVAYRLQQAEQLLWKKTCKECHTLRFDAPLPTVQKPEIPQRWMRNASFSHESHQLLDCEGCHRSARNSEKTSDVLLPGIQVCRECHQGAQSGAASDGCSECHTYHDWSKQKRVEKALFSAPGAAAGR